MLQINDLIVGYYKGTSKPLVPSAMHTAVNKVRLKISQGAIFALVGESGCGKTTLGLSITNLINPKQGRVLSGSVVFEEKNILRLSDEEMRDIRGKGISYVFQEPASSLNPVFTIGEQIGEALLVHNMVDCTQVKRSVLAALKEARLSDPERVYNAYPHQLSGGMKQRSMIAMAISTRPRLLIADEPTTALDADTESEILELLLLLRKELSLSVLFITHDIRIVERIADQVAVMYQGGIAEVGETAKVLNNPRAEYTKLLLDSMPEKLKL